MVLPPTSNYNVIEKTFPVGKNCILYEEKTPYQLIRLFQNDNNYWLSLNGELQFHTQECYASHQFMCQKALQLLKRSPKDVLIIGGGDGLPTRELLKFVPAITQVELDHRLIHLTRTHPIMKLISGDSFNNKRVKLIAGDGLDFLINSKQKYDLIIDDCDVDVSNQPELDPMNVKYTAYQKCMIDKLKPGGIAVVMEPIFWPWRKKSWLQMANIPQGTKSWLTTLRQWRSGPNGRFSAEQRKIWMEKYRNEGLEDWKKLTPYIKSCILDLPVIGPEHYIFMSNQPMGEVQ